MKSLKLPSQILWNIFNWFHFLTIQNLPDNHNYQTESGSLCNKIILCICGVVKKQKNSFWIRRCMKTRVLLQKRFDPSVMPVFFKKFIKEKLLELCMCMHSRSWGWIIFCHIYRKKIPEVLFKLLDIDMLKCNNWSSNKAKVRKTFFF